MGRGWTGFVPPPGYAHAPGGDAFALLPAVRRELARRVGAVDHEHVLATTVSGRQVLAARALDGAGRCSAQVLVVELDGCLPPLHLAPQRFAVEDDGRGWAGGRAWPVLSGPTSGGTHSNFGRPPWPILPRGPHRRSG